MVGEIEPEGSKGMLQTLAQQKVDFKITLVQGREWKQKRKLLQSSGAKSLIKGSGQEEMMSLLTGGVIYVTTLGSLAGLRCLEAIRTRKMYNTMVKRIMGIKDAAEGI